MKFYGSEDLGVSLLKSHMEVHIGDKTSCQVCRKETWKCLSFFHRVWIWKEIQKHTLEKNHITVKAVDQNLQRIEIKSAQADTDWRETLLKKKNMDVHFTYN